MRNKKGAFANSNTGYGKHSKHNGPGNHNSHRVNPSKTEKTIAKDRPREARQQDVVEQDQELNSGFGEYLRSPEAVEMMKMFVFANTVMLILTMAWPNIKEQYIMLRSWWASYESD